jgi:hypothetical protein
MISAALVRLFVERHIVVGDQLFGVDEPLSRFLQSLDSGFLERVGYWNESTDPAVRRTTSETWPFLIAIQRRHPPAALFK